MLVLSLLFALKSSHPSTQPLDPVPPFPFGGNFSLLSSAYIIHDSPSCLRLAIHLIPCALVLALARAGRSMLARIAIIAITTSSSIKVNAQRDWLGELLIAFDFGCFIQKFVWSC